jgi:hypothetical protein
MLNIYSLELRILVAVAFMFILSMQLNIIPSNSLFLIQYWLITRSSNWYIHIWSRIKGKKKFKLMKVHTKAQIMSVILSLKKK